MCYQFLSRVKLPYFLSSVAEMGYFVIIASVLLNRPIFQDLILLKIRAKIKLGSTKLAFSLALHERRTKCAKKLGAASLYFF
jgi:hypothetical protein